MIRATLILEDDKEYPLEYPKEHTLESVKNILGNAINSSMMYKRMIDINVDGKTIFLMPDKIKSVHFEEIKESEPV